ncbi:Uncharacterized [Moorella glycerini]|uniref:Uncharacterized protein n=1 Tax=Neomoorella stamsii TaxID=1266720 RepID=A0A9X7J2D2_9FIRM|nr:MULTISPECIES: hypothetical protein [Moorella]PRR71748.1 hypothetical protein MOST_23160 [Moorella stamsii]CEP67209.1 Uncharacterized [Moorella glycerini]
MKIPFIAWLLQGIPEAIGIAAVMYAAAGYGLPWRSILPTGLIFGVFFYLIRWLPIAFGVNTILNFLFTILVFKKVTSCNLAVAIRSGITALVTVVAGEILFMQFVIFASGFRLEEIYSHIWLRVLAGWPNVVLLLLVAIVSNRILNRRTGKGAGRAGEY